MKRREHPWDQGVDGGILLKWILYKREVRAWNRFMWFRIETSGRHL